MTACLYPHHPEAQGEQPRVQDQAGWIERFSLIKEQNEIKERGEKTFFKSQEEYFKGKN